MHAASAPKGIEEDIGGNNRAGSSCRDLSRRSDRWHTITTSARCCRGQGGRGHAEAGAQGGRLDSRVQLDCTVPCVVTRCRTGNLAMLLKKIVVKADPGILGVFHYPYHWVPDLRAV